LLEADNQHLDDLSALGLADKQDEDVGIHWNYKAKLV